MSNSYQFDQYLLTKKFFKLAGATFKIFDTSGNLCFFVKQKAFKLKEDIRVYSDESMAEELLLIKALRVLDISSPYDIIDSKTNAKIGAFRRKGLKSMIKDEWIIMDAMDNEVGIIQEDQMILALIRRFVTNLVPQSYDGLLSGSKVFTFKQHFNPFLLKMDLDFTCDGMRELDRRMGICAAILLGSIEGRQR